MQTFFFTKKSLDKYIETVFNINMFSKNHNSSYSGGEAGNLGSGLFP